MEASNPRATPAPSGAALTRVGSRSARLRTWVHENRAPLLLVSLSILIPEVLTGSTPVLVLLNPVSLLFLLGLYGGGVLLIREAAIAWGRGWTPVFLLGAAYGITEEAIGTKTFFDPVHNSFPPPWGHWLGVNWGWSVELTIFHAVFSIALPILLVKLAYPESRGHPFLTVRGRSWVLAGFLVTVALMFVLFDRTYEVAPALFAAAALAVVALVLAARKAPASWLEPRRAAPDRSPRAFLGLGAAFVWGFFALNWLFAGLTGNVWATIAVEIVLATVCARWLVAHLGSGAHELQEVYLALGLLSFLLAMATVEDLVGDWGSVLAVAALLYLVYRLRARWLGSARAARLPPVSPPISA